MIKLYGVIFLGAFFTLMASSWPDENKKQVAEKAASEKPAAEKAALEKPISFSFEKLKLAEYVVKDASKRLEIASDFVKSKGLTDDAVKGFNICLRYMGRNKSADLTVGEVLGWCLQDYKNDPKSLISNYIDYDGFEAQFSGWDGSHYKLEKYIKNQMHNPDSYEHVETKYRIVNGSKEKYGVVTTSFRGTNSYGGIVKSTVTAKVDLVTGDVIEVSEAN